MSLVNLDKSMGSLRTHEGRELEYEPFEFSAMSLGIISPEAIDTGISLQLETLHSGDLVFKVLAKGEDSQDGLFRYRLACEDQEIDLMNILDIDPNTGKLRFERQGNRLQYARFMPGKDLSLSAKTFGTKQVYQLEVLDVSRSGILAAWDNPWCIVPFAEGTLLELELNLTDFGITKTTRPLAKVVRHYSEGGGDRNKRYFALRIVDFSPEDQSLWHAFMQQLEAENIESMTMTKAA